MEHWKSALISIDSNLEQSAEIIEKSGLRIALVVGKKTELLGTLTDGDLRRSLLKRASMKTRVSDVMNPHPMVAREGWSDRRILSQMDKYNIVQMPIVDKKGIVVGLRSLHNILNKQKLENPVFLMAGGLGKRLKPLTDNCPKPMLRIGGKPILEHILLNFIEAGFYKFFISTHYLAEMVQSYFEDGSNWGVDIQYVHEENLMGTAGSLGLLPRAQIDLPIIVMNGDLLTSVNLQSLLDFHKEHEGVATICVRDYKHTIPFGVVESDGGLVKSLVEKPTFSWLTNAGLYVLDPKVIEEVPADVNIDMPVLLESCLNYGSKISIFPIHEDWIDVGQMHDFKHASSLFEG